jgi:hypothetical protein
MRFSYYVLYREYPTPPENNPGGVCFNVSEIDQLVDETGEYEDNGADESRSQVS